MQSEELNKPSWRWLTHQGGLVNDYQQDKGATYQATSYKEKRSCTILSLSKWTRKTFFLQFILASTIFFLLPFLGLILRFKPIVTGTHFLIICKVPYI